MTSALRPTTLERAYELARSGKVRKVEEIARILDREGYINAHIVQNGYFVTEFLFDRGLEALEGALAIGRQADPLGMEEAASRLNAARGPAKTAKKRSSSLPAKVKFWLGLRQALESAG